MNAAHLDMDDTGAWACRVSEKDLDARMAEKAEWLMHCPACNVMSTTSGCDCIPTEAASACSELLEPNDAPRRRLGPLMNWERRLLRRRHDWIYVAMLSASIGAAAVKAFA